MKLLSGFIAIVLGLVFGKSNTAKAATDLLNNHPFHEEITYLMERAANANSCVGGKSESKLQPE